LVRGWLWCDEKITCVWVSHIVTDSKPTKIFMLLYVPVTRADYHLAAPLFKWMAKIGGLGEHPMVVAVAKDGIPGVEEDILIREAMKLSQQVYRIEMGPHPEYGWPRSPNFIFQEAAIYAANNKAHGQKAWFFYELDCVPLKEGWLDELYEEYLFRERPCMGVINDTVRTTEHTQKVTGQHMVGAGIYCPDIFTRASICRHLHILGDPFDVAIEAQVVPMTWNTKMIQHNWSTKNYKYDEESGMATCENSQLRPASKDYAKPVDLGPRGPLVVHGVKDTTLIQLLERNFRNPPPPPTQPKPHRKARR
jgi:hypothetical protein